MADFYFDKKARHKQYSQEAARFEREKNYRRAIEKWGQAKLNAQTNEDREWCDRRIALCEWKEKNGV